MKLEDVSSNLMTSLRRASGFEPIAPNLSHSKFVDPIIKSSLTEMSLMGSDAHIEVTLLQHRNENAPLTSSRALMRWSGK